MPLNSLHSKPELLLRIAQGDEAAFTQLFKQYAKLLYSFLYEHTDSPQLADDLVQDIFTKLWLTRESLPNIKNIHAYLFTLARNHVINDLKKKIRERKRNSEWHEMLQTVNAGNEQQREVQLDIIDQAVGQLSAQQQRVWLMSRRESKKYSEIAAELGISKETVKKYLQYANVSITTYVLSKVDILLLLFFYFLKI